jgi:hypothetical protein
MLTEAMSTAIYPPAMSAEICSKYASDEWIETDLLCAITLVHFHRHIPLQAHDSGGVHTTNRSSVACTVDHARPSVQIYLILEINITQWDRSKIYHIIRFSLDRSETFKHTRRDSRSVDVEVVFCDVVEHATSNHKVLRARKHGPAVSRLRANETWSLSIQSNGSTYEADL